MPDQIDRPFHNPEKTPDENRASTDGTKPPHLDRDKRFANLNRWRLVVTCGLTDRLLVNRWMATLCT